MFPPKREAVEHFGSDFKFVYVEEKPKPEEKLVQPLITLEKAPKVGARKIRKIRYDIVLSTLTSARLTFVLNPRTGEELSAEFTGDVNIKTEGDSVVAYGEITLLDRSYYTFFKKFNATGKIRFNGSLSNPELDITAVYMGTHTVLTPGAGGGQTEDVVVKLTIGGTRTKPKIKFDMLVDGIDYSQKYPEGDVESDAISFILTGRFKDELTAVETVNFAESLVSSAGLSLLSSTVSRIFTDVLRDVFGGFITSAEIGYSGGFRGLRVTGIVGGAVVQVGGEIFTDISRTNISIRYPILRKIFKGNLMVEFKRRLSETFYVRQEKEIANTLRIYYRIKF